jgi:hypothetical protein
MNESYADFDQLLKGFVEEKLSSGEQQQFEEILKTDSLARQRYLDYISVDSMLANHQVEIEVSRKTPPKKKMKITSVRQRTEKRSKKKNSGVLLLMAASVFLAFAFDYYLKLQDEKVEQVVKVDFTVLEQFSGDVSIVSNGSSKKAVKGMRLQDGVGIVCSLNSQAQFRTADGSVFGIGPTSQLFISQKDGQYHLELKQGFINADVSKQMTGKPLLISTPKAGLTVLGTVLRIGASKTSTMLTVDEGRVQMENTQKQKVIVNTDETSAAEDGKNLVVRSLKEFKVDSLEIISASYGAEDKWIDVTAHIRLRAGNSRLVPSGAFVDLVGDPILKVVKSLKVEYRIDGKKGSFLVNEYKSDLVKQTNMTTEFILPDL